MLNIETPKDSFLTFHDAEAAMKYVLRERTSVLLTREAVIDFLGKHYHEIDELPVELMQSIHPLVDGDPNDDGTLNYTNVQHGDIESIHDDLPCGAEIREFVGRDRVWQMWVR